MISRGLGFLRSYDLSLPLFLFLSLPVCRRSSLRTGGGGGGKLYDRKEAWFLYEPFNTLCVDVASQYLSTLHFISVESKTPDHTTVYYRGYVLNTAK
jgi:hypothetical protein